MKVLATMTLFAAAASVACGQAAPAATSMAPTVGPITLPTLDGIFRYSLSASELVQTGYRSSGVGFSTVFSGDAAYNSKSEARPFSMVYAGGVMLGNQYGRSATTFQNLSLSQGLIKGAWSFGVSDSVSYLPQSPTVGLSGIPGVGDLGPFPYQGPSSGPAGGVLTNNMTSVSNALSGTVARRLTALTSAYGSASWMILRYPNSDFGLENSSVSGQAGLNHRLDVRDTISGSASYSTFSFGSGIDLTMQTKGINGAFQRVLSRTLSLSVSAGPQWISSSNSLLLPSRTTVAADLGLTYSREFTTASLSYTRGANGGSGVQPGAILDSVSASIGRTYGRDWTAGITGNYSHSNGLLNPGAITGPAAGQAGFLYSGGNSNAVYGGLQVSRRIGNSLSAYASYNLQYQSIDNSLAAQNAFSGTSNTFGVGISFSPRASRFGSF
jgi:hypothetical protein